MRPNKWVYELIGQEIINGFKGGQRAVGIKFTSRGKPTFTRGSRYPYGIWQQKSPDGTPYVPSPKSTVKIKKRDDRSDDKPRSSTPNTALVDQGELVQGLTYDILAGKGGVHVHFVSDEVAAKSLSIERGENFISKISGHITSQPKRPHRAIQDGVRDTIIRILRAWATKSETI